MKADIKCIQADLDNPIHREATLKLLSEYMAHPMGNGAPMPKPLEVPLIEGLKSTPNAFVLLAIVQEEIVGMATCFTNFSTFKAKPYINIHDIIVSASHRGRGLGRSFLTEIIAIARQRGCCKVTLEVRNDNPNAMHLYQSMGFKDCDPPMYFWSRVL